MEWNSDQDGVAGLDSRSNKLELVDSVLHLVVELRNNHEILPILYDDPISYVEEISLIEESYLWDNVRVYVDEPNSPQEFLILHSPSFYLGGKSLSAYMAAGKLSRIREFAEVLRNKRDFHTHLQTSPEAEPIVYEFMDWLTNSYTVRYCRADNETFKPHCYHRARALRLTPENIQQLDPSASPSYIKRLETAPVYGYVNENGELVATSGVGFLTRKSFSISYTETEPEYRGRGIAKCLTFLASEELIRKGLVGVYAADITNLPSLGVAEGLGFKPYRDLKCFYN